MHDTDPVFDSRAHDVPADTSSIRGPLLEAATGLTFDGVGGHPFEFFSMTVDHHSDLDAATFAHLIGETELPADERTDEAFFDQLRAATGDDDAGPERRARLSALHATLREHLRELRVFRLGHGRVDCYVVGWDADGRLAGLRTVAIES
jgi:hypothetical protein